jgi:hypothetical protein
VTIDSDLVSNLQPICFEEFGKTITKLKDREFRYRVNEGMTARFRQAARNLGMPDELFRNFVTLFDPDITFVGPPRSRRRVSPS